MYRSTLDRLETVGARTLLMGHAFKGAPGDLGPVASGPAVGEVLRESLVVDQALTEAVKRALSDAPHAGGGEIARRAVAGLRASLGLEDEPTSGLPISGPVTLPAYLGASQG